LLEGTFKVPFNFMSLIKQDEGHFRSAIHQEFAQIIIDFFWLLERTPMTDGNIFCRINQSVKILIFLLGNLN